MKNVFRISLLAFFAFSLASCNNDSIEAGDANFSASLSGAVNTTVLIMEANPFIVSPDTVETDANGNFVYSKYMEGPGYFEMLVGSQSRIPFFLLPNDTLFLSADIAQFSESQQFSGSASIYNNYISQFTKASTAFQSDIYAQFSKQEDQAIAAMDSLRDANNSALNSLKQNNADLNAYFVEMEEARILYEWAVLHNIYPMYFKYLNKIESFEPSPEYTAYLGAVDINDSSLLSLGIYQTFLDTYVGVEMENYYSNDALIEANPCVILYRLELIDQLFSNAAVKQVMAYKAVMDYVRYEGVKDFELYSELFMKICPHDGFQGVVNSVLSKWAHLKKGMPAFEFSFVDMDGVEVSMSDFTGKYVYVDVWATWCNPCIGEIPYLKSMEQNYHGKNIVFVSISVDQTQEPWKAMVVNDTLKGVQLWAGQNKEFSDFYKITGIPRFMLFDMEGNIIESSATRPSGGVEQQIAALPGL